MSERINKLYKPAELQTAIEVLDSVAPPNITEADARAMVVALHRRGYRIVFVGKVAS